MPGLTLPIPGCCPPRAGRPCNLLRGPPFLPPAWRPTVSDCTAHRQPPPRVNSEEPSHQFLEETRARQSVSKGAQVCRGEGDAGSRVPCRLPGPVRGALSCETGRAHMSTCESRVTRQCCAWAVCPPAAPRSPGSVSTPRSHHAEMPSALPSHPPRQLFCPSGHGHLKKDPNTRKRPPKRSRKRSTISGRLASLPKKRPIVCLNPSVSHPSPRGRIWLRSSQGVASPHGAQNGIITLERTPSQVRK